MPGFTADAFFNPKDDVAASCCRTSGRYCGVAQMLGEHVRARLDGKPAVSLAEVTIPPPAACVQWIRLLTAYWLTMIAAGVFVFGLAMSVQGIAASCASPPPFPARVLVSAADGVLPHRRCLLSSADGGQARGHSGGANGGACSASPSYWFLGLFQELSGSPALAPWRAVPGRAGTRGRRNGDRVRSRTVARFGGSRSNRTLRPRRPSCCGCRPLGTRLQTAIVQFGVRTLFRSAPHRVILAFYWGIGFALAIIFLKSPRGQQLAEVSVAAHGMRRACRCWCRAS